MRIEMTNSPSRNEVNTLIGRREKDDGMYYTHLIYISRQIKYHNVRVNALHLFWHITCSEMLIDWKSGRDDYVYHTQSILHLLTNSSIINSWKCYARIEMSSALDRGTARVRKYWRYSRWTTSKADGAVLLPFRFVAALMCCTDVHVS